MAHHPHQGFRKILRHAVGDLVERAPASREGRGSQLADEVRNLMLDHAYGPELPYLILSSCWCSFFKSQSVCYEAIDPKMKAGLSNSIRQDSETLR